MTTHVTETTAAPPEVAIKHFQEMLAFETDCWDVHESLKSANPDFIVVDVRGPSAFAKGHVKGAINIPHSEMTATRMAEYQKDKVLVVYCAVPVKGSRTARAVAPLAASGSRASGREECRTQ